MDDLIAMSKALDPLENKIHEFNKKAAGAAWGTFKRLLGTASEPFFRKGMGERYYTAESHVGGLMIWIGATVFACVFPTFSIAYGISADVLKIYSLARFFSSPMVPLVVGGALAFYHLKFGTESVFLMQKYRAEGTAYHTMSRGVARWGDANSIVAAVMTVGLLMFDLPAGVLFIAACSMSSKIAAEQQAAIYSRYLDALDQRVEQEYMEKAILGQCPTEITYLHKPLDANMNEDLKKNIAAAAVGKPVKILAKSLPTKQD